MAQLLGIFDFVSVLLRGTSLALEALTVGGVIFILLVARGMVGDDAMRRLLRWLVSAALLLATSSLCAVALTSAALMSSTDLKLPDITGAGFWISGVLTVSGAAGLALLGRTRWRMAMFPVAVVAILIGSVMVSHSVARLDHRWFLIACTVAHHLAGAAWIGGLPFLLITLRHMPPGVAAAAVTARFSRLAMVSVSVLIAAGAALACVYVGSPVPLGETTYGVMLSAKIILTGFVLLLGALNLRIVRAARAGAGPSLLPLRRFGEAEIGIGFTILLAAASLTSTPPAVDVVVGRVTLPEIVERIRPQWPRMETPPVSALAPATPFSVLPNSALPGSFVPGQRVQTNGPADIAWSEYNHHWSGLVVLALGVLAIFSRRFSWARHWPLVFFGLAVFLLVRADSENWPLGPRGFWESFQVAEVAQHRIFVLLIVLFAIFEWAVQTRRLDARRAGLVFPLVCSVGGALLLTHSHSLSNLKEEFLGELSHIPLGILAVVAGWSRWLEIRLPAERPRAIAWIWPVCFVLIGSILMLYRES